MGLSMVRDRPSITQTLEGCLQCWKMALRIGGPELHGGMSHLFWGPYYTRDASWGLRGEWGGSQEHCTWPFTSILLGWETAAGSKAGASDLLQAQDSSSPGSRHLCGQ